MLLLHNEQIPSVQKVLGNRANPRVTFSLAAKLFTKRESVPSARRIEGVPIERSSTSGDLELPLKVCTLSKSVGV